MSERVKADSILEVWWLSQPCLQDYRVCESPFVVILHSANFSSVLAISVRFFHNLLKEVRIIRQVREGKKPPEVVNDAAQTAASD